MYEPVFSIKSALRSMIVGSLVRFTLAIVDLPSPALTESIGVIVGACNLSGLFLGYMVANTYA
jgi:hypothetical protein